MSIDPIIMTVDERSRVILELFSHRNMSLYNFGRLASDQLHPFGVAAIACIYSITAPSDGVWSSRLHLKARAHLRYGGRTSLPLVQDVNDLRTFAIQRGWVILEIEFQDYAVSGQSWSFVTFFVLEPEGTLNDGALQILKDLLSSLYAKVLHDEQLYFRGAITTLGAKSRDLNSFIKRVIDALVVGRLSIPHAMCFVQRPRQTYLQLSAHAGIRTKKKRKDEIQLFDTSQDVFSQVFRENRSLVVRHFEGFLSEIMDTFHFELKGIEFWHHGILPLSPRRNTEVAIDSNLNVGVAWVATDAKRARRLGDAEVSYGLTWEDWYLLDCLAEEVAFRSQVYRHSNLVELEFDRVCHGINVDLVSAKQGLDIVLDELFTNGNYIVSAAPNTRRRSDEERELRQFRHYIETSIALIDDLFFQVNMAQRDLNPAAAAEDDVVYKLFGDVLQKVVNLAPGIAVAHSRGKPKISDLRAARADELPPVVGSEAALVSVFRNIFENAIKYTKPESSPAIDVWFEESDVQLVVHVRDYGIGVPETEERFLFREGFRGSWARRVSFRGSGIGLAYCKRTMRALGGDIDFQRKDPGSMFSVYLKKVRAGTLQGEHHVRKG